MHSTGSILKDIVNRGSLYTNQLFESGKYKEDDYMPVLEEAFEEALNRVSKADQQRVVSRFSLDLVADQEYYTLPPTVTKLIRVVRVNEQGDETYEWDARGELHPQGSGFILDGMRSLRFDPVPKAAESLEVWFEAGPSFGMHFSNSGGVVTSATTFTLDTFLNDEEDLGMYDRRTNAYVGARLRILNNGGTWEETVVTSQSSNSITVRDSLVTSTGGSIRYEIVPTYLQPIVALVSWTFAIKMGTALQLSQTKLRQMDIERASALKTVRELVSNVDERRGRFWETDTRYSREMVYGEYLPVVS